MTTDLGIYRDAVSTANALIIMEKGNLIEKQQICLDANSAASRGKFLHFKSVLTILALCLCMAVGACSGAWAAEETVTWTATNHALDSNPGTISTGGFEWRYERTGNNTTAWQNSCVQVGKKNNPAGLTFRTSNIPGIIKSVSIECSSAGGRHNVSITVGGNIYLSATSTPSWTTIGAKSGTGTSSGEIVISFTSGNGALYIKSITVVYETASPSTYTVTYDGNGSTGGTPPTDNTSYSSGTTVTVLGNTGSLVKTGYTFNGWNTAANGSGTPYAAGATFTISSNTTLYAQWADAGSTPCTPTWDSGDYGYISNFTVTQGGSTLLNSGSTGTANSNTDYYSSRSITAAAGSTINLSITSSGSSDTYGFAVWIDFDADGMETSDMVLNTSTYVDPPYSGSYTIPANTPAGEYRLRILQDYYTGAPSNPCGSYDNGESEDYKLIVTAPVYYTVTYNGNGSTGGTPPTDAGSYLPGASATVLGNTGSLVKTGYTFGGWNTRADGNGTTYAAGDNLTVAGNTILYALWLRPYTVTWSIDGTTTTQNYPIGGSYALTVPSGVATDATSYNCYDRVFVGWTANSSYSSDNPPADLFRTPSGNVSANVTYYAVFAYESGLPATWELVNNVSELAVGDKVVIAASGYDYAISTTQNSNNRAQAEITRSGSAITWTSSVCEFDLKAGTVSGTWAFYDATNTGYIYAASSSSNYLRTQSTNDANGSWTISISSGIASITAQGTNTRNKLYYNSSDNLFSCYSTDQKVVAIYKKVSSYYGYSTSCTPCTEPTFSLPSASGIVNMGGTLSISLTNPNNTEVTWTSSNPSIATVSGTNTGATITGVNYGSATITASIRAANVSGTYYCPAIVTYNVTVACATIMLPVCFDFEDYASPNSSVSTDAGLPTCWNRIYSGSSSGYAPHVFNGTYAMNDNGIVITSGSSSYGSTNYVVMPFIDGLHEDDIIRFNAWCENSSYGTLTFGYMTDPSNAATFNSIGTATAEYYSGGSASTGQNEFTIPAAMPSGAYLAFKWYNSSSFYSVVIDNICIEHACTPILGTLTLTTTSGSILASETLDISGYVNNGIDQTTYPGTLSYISSNDNVATVSAAGVITGVAEGSATIFVRYTPDDIGQCAKTAEFTVVVTDGCMRLGNGSTSSSSGIHGGIYTYFNYYAYTQQLYTASEIIAAGGGAGVVNEIALNYNETTSSALSFEVYLGQTSQNSVPTSWISDAGLTLVYSGTKTFSAGWNNIDISSHGWEWDGSSNIVVAIRRTSKDEGAVSYPDFYHTNSTEMACYYSNSSSSVILDGSNVATESGTQTSERPEMKFCIEMCTRPTGTFAFTSDVMRISNGATLNLALPANFTNTLSPSGTVTYISSNPTVASVTNAGLVSASASAHGIAVITATFTPDNDDYCEVTANITIDVACSYSSPVCFDFEDYTASANTQYYADAGLPDCWSRIYSGTYVGGEPHGYNGSVAKDGTGIIITSGIYDEYDENFGYTNYVVMPYISGLAAGDMVSFNAWWQYINYGTLTLGYMTNPADASTFVAIDNATPFLYNFGSATAGTNLIELPVGLPSGAYLAFKWFCQSDYYSYSVVIDNVCICSAVAGTFELTTTSGDVTAMHTLDISGYVNSTIDTNVTPGEIVYSTSNPDVAIVSSEGVIMGLSEGETTITVEFVPDNTTKCPRFATFTISVNDGCTKVGDGGTNTTYYVPVNTYYKYTYSQIIYDKNELTAGLITAIGFEYAYSSDLTSKNDVKMYLVETDKTSFSGTSDWVTTVTESNLVYSGVFNCSEGWNSFNLDEPFTYSGTHNLLLVIDDNSGSYNSRSYVFRYTATGSNTVLHYYDDTYNYGNTDIDGQTASGCIANRPNTKFCIFDGALHTLTYNTSTNCTGGVASSIEAANVVEGQLALLSSEVPTCSTGIFQHWNTSDDDSGTSYAPGAVISVGSSDITLYAIYRICDYVSVSRNGQPAQGIGDGAYDSDGYQKFNACQGSDLSLIATKKDGVAANFTSFLWDVNRHDGNTHLTSDANTLTYTVDNAMGHDILLSVEADDGCKQNVPLRVWVSHGLTMAGDSPTAGEICVGAGKEIYVGDPQVVPQSIIEVDNEAIEITSTKGEAKIKFIPDGVGECYTSDVEFADFREDVTITDASNIDYVRINLEHSFIGDMQISLKCYTPEHEERTAILLQDAYDLYDGGLDNAEYDWPYIYINCFAKYKKYNNPEYSSGECSQGSYIGEVNENVYVKYDGTAYSATGVRIEASAFDKDLTTAQKLEHLKGMINSGHDPEPFCDGGYYYVFDSWLYNANHYTTDNYASTPTESQWSGRYIASLGFGKPNALDGLDGSEITDIAYNPYGEGLDYCWSNSDSYTYADGDGNILDTDNHKIGYTNGTIVKPSDVDGGTQFYHPYQSFQSLVGCKLNGVWTIQICDSWGLDNGYIFSWEIGLKNVDDNAWSYDVSLVDSHMGTCGGFDPDDRNNSENLISEIDGEPNFYIHPTIANVASLPVTIGATRNCELTLIDNIGCETTGNGFTYTVVQPTVPEIAIPAICIGEETTVTADLTTGAVAGPSSSFTWWRTKDGNKTLIDSETGITTSSLSILPTTTDSIYSAEIYDAAGCGGIIDGVVTINVPDDVTDVADYNYIWHGKYINATSTDWNTPSNWILYNSGTSTYSVSSANVPTIGDNVYIGSAKCGRTNPSLTAESFANDLTIASAATLTIPAEKTLNIAGDLTNTGTMTANNTSTVVFKGSNDQTISNAQGFGNVTFSQQATGHTINATNGITVNNKATFTQGVLKGNAEFASTATVNDPDNMTYNSFVDGTVTRTTSAAGEFTFPTGSGSVLGTVKASLPASSTIGATFYHSSGTGFDMPDADLCADNSPRLDHVSSHEYWKINTSSSLSSATLKVSSSNPGDHFTIPGATTYEGSHIYGTILQGGCWKTISSTPSEVNGDHNTITISDVNIPAVSMRAEPQPMSLGSTTSSTLLPIELTALTATCDGRKALVEWTTASERNNDYFSLERSDDAINFTEIARIAGAGNSIAPLDYSYTDYGVHGGDNYYRLVQVDYDGTRTASEIVVANCIEASGEPEVLAYPNPFSGDLTVELENFGDRPARIDVYDMLGRLVYTEEVGAPQNSYQTVLHFGNLPDATYTVRVGTADFVINRKVVKQQ